MINVDARVLDDPDTQPDPAPSLPDAYSAVLAQAVMPAGVAPPVVGQRRWRHWLVRLLSLVVAVGLWQLAVQSHFAVWLRFAKLPAPSAVAGEFVAQLQSGSFYRNLIASVQRILEGFGIATFLGIVLGIAIGRSRLVSAALRPVLEALRPVPAIAWVPIAILLFPSGEQGIVFITFLAAFFPVVVSTQHAVRTMPVVWEEAARTLGARRSEILLRVVLPGALPGIVSGLSVAMGVAWICVVSAEMISGQFGIGYYTWQSYGLINYKGVVVGMVAIGVLGWLSAACIELIGRRATHWLPRAES
jgi:NitT/TauT family transport system permease protein